MRVILAELTAAPAMLAEIDGEMVLILNEDTTPKPLAATLRRLFKGVHSTLTPQSDG